MQANIQSHLDCSEQETHALPHGATLREPVQPADRRASRGHPWLWPAVIISGFLLAAHGWALWDGLFLDDHLHVLRYADHHWSWQSLLDAATVKPDEFIDSWWQERPIEWHYTRPFSILLGKIVFKLSNGSVMALHALSLALHLANSLMVFALARMLTRRTSWAIVAGLLFVVYSHSVYAVAWLAAQNSVLQTTLTLAAMLAYIRASRLDLFAAPPSARRPNQSFGAGWFALTLLFWILALLSRETAIVLPVMLVALDLAFGGWRHVRSRLVAYLLMACLGVSFLIWRFSLAYHPIPGFYMRQYDGPGYILWYLAKLLHWVTAAIWLSPMTIGPTARINPFRETPWDCLLMLVIICVMSIGYILACRRARGWWLWPLWILLTFLPVVPVMAGPQSGYMAGVGFALAMVLGPALRDELRPTSIGRWSKPIAIWFLIATCIYIPIYRAMWRSVNAAERLTTAGVAACPPAPGATDLFFINLPFVDVYAGLQVREALHCPDRPLRAHALTYAPNLLLMEHPTVIEQLDTQSFRVRTDGGRPYFSGALGRYLFESMRPSGRLTPGEVVKNDTFDVEVVQADQDGTRELTFRFREALTSPKYCFYVTTRECGAARLAFRGVGQEPSTGGKIGSLDSGGGVSTPEALQDAAIALGSGHALAAEKLFTAALSDDKKIRELAMGTLRGVVGPVTRALAAPIQLDTNSSDWTPQDLARVSAWWSRHVDDENLRALLDQREESAAQVWERDRLFRIREIASHVIKTDLYLTGPPFPSPR